MKSAYLKKARISTRQFRKFLQLFAMDLTTLQITELMHWSRNTANLLIFNKTAICDAVKSRQKYFTSFLNVGFENSKINPFRAILLLTSSHDPKKYLTKHKNK